jgi:pimeloyl-ACP methyl ester carboxylesterase
VSTVIHTPERQQLQIGPASIHYEVAGAGAPVVLVHGLSGSCRWWRRNIGPLARIFQVYTIDLIGFGGSRAQRPFVLSEAAGYLAQWMDRLGIASASLVGHSMGGFVVAELAADFPGRVDRLVLVDAAALPFDQSYLQHTHSMIRELRQLSLEFLPVLFADALRAGPATIWRAAADLLRSDLRAKLARIQAPTLTIWGERDAIIPLDMGKRLAQQMPGHELVVIKGAGHNPMWDCPRAFNDVLAKFLVAGAEAQIPHVVACRPAERALEPESSPRFSSADSTTAGAEY